MMEPWKGRTELGESVSDPKYLDPAIPIEPAPGSSTGVRWVDCFFDIECYNCTTENTEGDLPGIQKPYIIYFYNPEYTRWNPVSNSHEPVYQRFVKR